MRAFFSRTDKFWVGLSDFCCLTLCLKVFTMRKKLDSRIHMKHKMRQHDEEVGLPDFNEAQIEAQVMLHDVPHANPRAQLI